MKRILFIVISALFVCNIFANINYIDINKISKDKKYIDAFDNIKNNQNYYAIWYYEWNFDISKEDIVNNLKKEFDNFSSIKSKNIELYLLLGDIAHFLYNLEVSEYNNIAVENYNQAIKLNPNEYRAYWFMATHYSQMGNSVQAMENMYKAQNLLPKKEPADFWNEFTCAAVFANMPSHAIFAMKKETKILGHKGNAEEQLGKSIYEKIESVDKYKSYKNTEIWNAEDVGNLAQFISRPLGIKLLVDTICKLSIYDYKNNSAAFMIASPLIKKNNKEIGYTIAILMKTAEEKDKLEDYLNNFIKPYNNKKKVIFSTKYENIIAYEIKESSMYKDNGGGHLYMIGIERNEPEISGLLLETPELLQNKTDEIQYYRASSRKDRFKGKIFYAIMLDTCEDIFEVSYRDFKNFFDNLVIE